MIQVAFRGCSISASQYLQRRSISAPLFLRAQFFSTAAVQQPGAEKTSTGLLNRYSRTPYYFKMIRASTTFNPLPSS